MVRCAVATLALLALTLTACSDDAVLYVDLKTDLVAGVEFDEVRVSAIPATGDGRVVNSGIQAGAAWVRGVRVAEIEGLPHGAVSLTVELRRGPQVVAERPVVVAFSKTSGVTVAIARSCLTVTCPGTGADARLSACHGGRCVDPGCSEESPELCGVPACVSPADCPPPGGACAAARCEGGVCLDEGTSSLCGAEEYCDPAAGCTSGPPADAGVDSAVDSGVSDAGRDGGSDSGADAGDAGPTDEVCNGVDDDGDERIDEAVTGDYPTVCYAFGSVVLGTGRQNMTTDNVRVSLFTLGARSEVTALYAHLVSTGASPMPVRGVIYSPATCIAGRACGDLLATSDEVIAASGAGGWVRLALPTPITLEAGDYYLGVQNGAPGEVYTYAYSTGAGERWNWSSAYVASPPAVFDTSPPTSGDITMVAEIAF